MTERKSFEQAADEYVLGLLTEEEAAALEANTPARGL